VLNKTFLREERKGQRKEPTPSADASNKKWSKLGGPLHNAADRAANLKVGGVLEKVKKKIEGRRTRASTGNILFPRSKNAEPSVKSSQ